MIDIYKETLSLLNQFVLSSIFSELLSRVLSRVLSGVTVKKAYLKEIIHIRALSPRAPNNQNFWNVFLLFYNSTNTLNYVASKH